ncbi:hypothetical protein [Intrasporangium sp. YIM S08009]|uniref:hypothetical protein n=1 Tax=Intrasporangium zincisolvens TaxID=3080018 RepID=UPI002B05D6CB|nr:hypothetical protein [Intrasporangium sp. YIM S08009]
MNPVILDEATSLVAAWPLVLVGLVIAALVGNAFVRGGRRTDGLHDWRGEPQTRTCRSMGHRYVKDATGWCCSHCGDEIRHDTPTGRVREAAGV